MQTAYGNIGNSSISEDEDYNLWLFLSVTWRMVFKAFKKELHKYGITPAQAAAFQAIKYLGQKATLTQISRLTFREVHSVSSLIDRMEEKGLVKKVRDLHQKNFVRVLMTDKGTLVYNQSIKREAVHFIMSSLSEEEHRQLRSCVSKLRAKTVNWLFPRPQ